MIGELKAERGMKRLSHAKTQRSVYCQVLTDRTPILDSVISDESRPTRSMWQADS